MVAKQLGDGNVINIFRPRIDSLALIPCRKVNPII